VHLSKVIANHFGPFENETLDLGRGFTVVWGLNEAGKSSWHSAVGVTIGGRRRNKGGGTKAEREFRERYRPWDGSGWSVGGELRLDDGRCLQVKHDLEAKTGTVLDLDFGTDLSKEFVNDGGIDLCQLVGLDRATFAATACVRQADLFAIRENADALQEHMQRAAATAGTDATAAAALETIAEYGRWAVGLDRANSTKPLRQAVIAKNAAELALGEAEGEHRERLELVKTVQLLEQGRVEAQQRLTVCELALALATATANLKATSADVSQFDDLEKRVSAAGEEVDFLSAEVALTKEALKLRQLQDAATAVDAEAVEIQSLLTDLAKTQSEVGRLQTKERSLRACAALAQASEAETAVRRAHQIASVHTVKPPSAGEFDDAMTTVIAVLEAWKNIPEGVPLSGQSAQEIEAELAAVPEPPAGDIQPRPSIQTLVGAREETRHRLEGHDRDEPGTEAVAATGSSTALLAAGAVMTIGGIGLAAALHPTLGVVALVGLISLILGTKQRAKDAVLRRGMDEHAAWLERRSAVLIEEEDRAAELRAALAAAGADNDADVDAMLDTYRRQCHQRAEQLRLSKRRPDLENQLILRRAAEDAATQAASHREATWAGAVEVAGEAGISAEGTADQLFERLDQWLGGKRDHRSQLEQDRKEWSELQQILGGSTLEDFQDEVGRLRREADELAAGFESDQVPTLDPNEALREAAVQEGEIGELGHVADALKATIEERQRTMQDPVGAAGAAASALADFETSLCNSSASTVEFDPSRLPVAAALQSNLASLDTRLTNARNTLATAKGERQEQVRHVGDPVEDQAKVDSATAELRAALANAPHLESVFNVENLSDLAALETERDSFAETLDETVKKAATAKGQLSERIQNAPDLPKAKETLEATEIELKRVRNLEKVLHHATSFLSAAQERVHRNIAPRLRETVEGWLPTIFAGRYDHVLINPVDLDVHVGGANGELQRASLLSHGTAEQIYLLLRVALVEHLTSGENCPLLLDEVTAHADDARSKGMLELLHQLSQDRQIVVFSQESRVRDWARQNLTGERDRLVELAAP